MENINEPYITLYSEFMKNYNSGSTTGENVGELIAKLAGFYPHYNALMIKADRSYSLITRDEVLKTDEVSGKAISVSKAETIANASVEASTFKKARGHVQNLEMLIQSAKALQRGLMQEMMHANL